MSASAATRLSDCRCMTISSANQLVAAPARKTASKISVNLAPSENRFLSDLNMTHSNTPRPYHGRDARDTTERLFLLRRFRPSQQRLHLRQQAVELDRLHVIVITPRLHRPFAVARHGMRGQRDHGNVPRCLPG